MTVNLQEDKAQEPLQQEKVDTNLTQKKDDTNKTQDQTKAQDQTTPSEQKEDPNWKAFREARKKDRAEREAAEKRAAEKEAEATALKAAMEAAFAKGSSVQQAPVDQYGYQQEETQDQLIEKKIQAALEKREEQYHRETEQRE